MRRPPLCVVALITKFVLHLMKPEAVYGSFRPFPEIQRKLFAETFKVLRTLCKFCNVKNKLTLSLSRKRVRLGRRQSSCMIDQITKVLVAKESYGNRDMNISGKKDLRKFYRALSADDSICSPGSIHTASLGLLKIIRASDSKLVNLPFFFFLFFRSVFTCNTK
jgi:hypothetical protein